MLERRSDAWCQLLGQGCRSLVLSTGPQAVGLWLLLQSKSLTVAATTGTQLSPEQHVSCSASSQCVCFPARVERLPVAVISSDRFPNSWETKSGLFSCRADEYERRFSVVGSPCGLLQTPFGGQFCLCCLFLPHLVLKQHKATAQS